MVFYVYIIKCYKYDKNGYKDMCCYTGMTGDAGVGVRFEEHKRGIKSAWMKMNNWIPIQIIYVEEVEGGDYYAALRREQQIKGWSKKKRVERLKEYTSR